jgi:hypothetical protein
MNLMDSFIGLVFQYAVRPYIRTAWASEYRARDEQSGRDSVSSGNLLRQQSELFQGVFEKVLALA